MSEAIHTTGWPLLAAFFVCSINGFLFGYYQGRIDEVKRWREKYKDVE